MFQSRGKKEEKNNTIFSLFHICSSWLKLCTSKVFFKISVNQDAFREQVQLKRFLSPGTQSKKIKADPEIFSASRGTATNTEEVS